MKGINQMEKNRTGIKTAPKLMAEQLRQAAEDMEIPNIPLGDPLAEIRASYIREAEKVGTVPMPIDAKSRTSVAAQFFKGKKTQIFVDKLGERLSFERSGVRLYDALITKCEAFGENQILEELKRYRSEEADHFLLLKECMEELGADPTSVTPSADISAVASSGVMKVITDPRTTVVQSLEAILIAELVDRDAWDLLIDLADAAGLEEMADQFEEAFNQEKEHLSGVRRMVKSLNLDEQALIHQLPI